MAEMSLLCSSTKLQRDRGLLELQHHLSGENTDNFAEIQNDVLKLFDELAAPWETKHGALTAATEILRHEWCPDEFAEAVKGHALRLLEDSEYRVRIAAGDFVGALCQRYGSVVYSAMRDLILEGVRDNLERHSESIAGMSEQEETERLFQKLSSSPSTSPSAEQIFHDTAGWKSLETWMKCLQKAIEGCGYSFESCIDQQLLDLIFYTLTHTNRFVRETGYQVCGSMVAYGIQEEGENVPPLGEDSPILIHGDAFTKHLANGLADNWSQVRLAASVATRKFLLSLQTSETRERFYSQLIPPMCLNRYYVAEGVRIYSQDTWKLVTGGEGKQLVEKNISNTVQFYVVQTEADNHAVREAACACIAELGSKIDKEIVRPHVSQLLDALLVCFRDQSWPVRDAACVACGNFILCFPEESRPLLNDLYPLFFENLQDNIPSVRQGSALALFNVAQAYGGTAVDILMDKIKEGLEGVAKQPETAERYNNLDKGLSTYGVVKRARDNDMDLHTNQPMFSCGSLAPKMGRGNRAGGCMDHQFRRPAEPWELAEGCIHLLTELCSMSSIAQRCAKQLPLLAKAASHRHYTQHVSFLESLCKQIPSMCQNMGKRMFKMYLELFIDAIFYSLSCDNALTSSAASQCLNQLSTILGPNILRGRVEQYDPRLLQKLDANQFVAPM